jgi:hypothetical protein
MAKAAAAKTLAPTYAPGRGTIVFNADAGYTCFGRVRRDGKEYVVQGTYSSAGATLVGELCSLKVVRLEPKVNARVGVQYPVARAELVFTDTGEVHMLGVFAPTKPGAVAHGLTDDVRGPQTLAPANLKPFG